MQISPRKHGSKKANGFSAIATLSATYLLIAEGSRKKKREALQVWLYKAL
jgi:hypothetical protein